MPSAITSNQSRLLFLYVNDRKLFQPLQANFVSGFKFSFCVNAAKPVLEVERSQDDELPSDFFSLRKGQGNDDDKEDGAEPSICVSAIVGKNGSGKSSIAKCLETLFTAIELDDHRFLPAGDYVMVVDNPLQKGHLQVYYLLEDFNTTGADSVIDIKCVAGSISRENFACHRLTDEPLPIDFVYYSPCYSPVHLMRSSCGPHAYDISVSGRLRNNAEQSDLVSPLLSHDTQTIIDALTASNRLNAVGMGADYNVDSISGISKVTIQPSDDYSRIMWRYVAKKLNVVAEDIVLRGRDGCSDLSKLKADVFVGFLGALFERDIKLGEDLNGDKRDVCDLLLKMNFDEPFDERFKKAYDALRQYRDELDGETQWRRGFKQSLSSILDVLEILDGLSQEQSVEITGGNVSFKYKTVDSGFAIACTLLEKSANRSFAGEYLEVFFNPEVSSGELSFLSLWGLLLRIVTNKSRWNVSIKKSFVLFLDESETMLHPVWQSQLVRNMVVFFERILPDVRVHIIFASHSPILLSDIPRGNVVFLRRNEDNHSEAVSVSGSDTFAANIFNLYKDSFFLDKGPMGTFAKDKIDALLEKLNPKRKDNETDEEYNKRTEIGEDDLKIARLIGDPFLSRYVWRRLEELGKDYGTPDDESRVRASEERS